MAITFPWSKTVEKKIALLNGTKMHIHELHGYFKGEITEDVAGIFTIKNKSLVNLIANLDETRLKDLGKDGFSYTYKDKFEVFALIEKIGSKPNDETRVFFPNHAGWFDIELQYMIGFLNRFEKVTCTFEDGRITVVNKN